MAESSVEQILPPFVVAAAHQAHDVAAGVEVEGARLTHQLHAGFGGELIALAAVAGMAAGHQIFPGGRSSAGARDDVIERQLTGRHYSATVLATVAVAQQ